MKLEKIGIANFRCFESLDLALEPDVNLIVGTNGAGKSAILDAIAVALFDVVVANSTRTDQARRKQSAALKPTDIHIPAGPGQTGELRKDYVHISASASHVHPTKVFGMFASDPESCNLEWHNHILFSAPNSFRYTSTDTSGFVSLNSYMRSLWDVYRDVPRALDPLPAIAYYRSDRRLKTTPQMGDVFAVSFEREAAFDGALDAGSDYQAMCRWLYLTENMELRQRNNATAIKHSLLDAMRAALSLIVEGVDDVSFSGMPPKLTVSLTKDGGLVQRSLDQLSDGYRNLIGMCLDFGRRLALANPYSPKPLGEPGVLLIDEIELHLHPAWQQTILPKLTQIFTGTQIIATTHSPQVLSTAESRCIRILNDTKLYSAGQGSLGSESKRLLEEVFGVNSRPPGNLISAVRKMEELYSLINAGKLPAAKEMVQQFIRDGYETDSAIIEANAIIENRLWEEGPE